MLALSYSPIKQRITTEPKTMTHKEELTILTESLFDLHNSLTVWKNLSAAGSGLSPPQINVLEVIGNNYTLKMKELALKLGVTTGSLSVMIDRLEKKGLVNRKPSEDDRRSTMVYLTGTGRTAFLSRYMQQLEFINKNLKKLDEFDRKLISTSIKKLLRLIQDSTL